MRSFAALEAELTSFQPLPTSPEAAVRLLAMAEEVIEQWLLAKGPAPTAETVEGSRLLALHRQAAKGVPSFNACRETCREIAYHFNLLALDPAPPDAAQRQRMMAMLVKHLLLFVRGKLEIEGLGDFCCASRPLRQAG